MPKLSPARPEEVVKVLERLGFIRIRKVEAMPFIITLMEDGQQCRCIKAEN